jgi:hypothetical protein
MRLKKKALNGKKTPEANYLAKLYQTNVLKIRKYSHTNPPYLEEAAALSFAKANTTFINWASVVKEKGEE